MKVLNSVSQIPPLFLLGVYITLFFFTGFDIYFDQYSNLAKIDTFLMITSIVGAIFFIRKWKNITVIGFITLIMLNILTEVGMRIRLANYYNIYENIIIAFFILLMIFSTKRNK